MKNNKIKETICTSFTHMLNEKAFEKITICALCDACKINRKSFYYYFKDKYDLCNYIFKNSTLEKAREKENFWEALKLCLNEFCAKKSAYKNLFNYYGQNSFCEFFREELWLLLNAFYPDKSLFTVTFYSDAIFCAIKRFINEECPVCDQLIADIKQNVRL